VSRKRTLGLLVCGGQSRRMGTDKALVDLAGSRFLDRAMRSLESVSYEVLLATGAEPRYAELGRECVLDEVQDAGPLSGLVAGLRAARDRGAASLAISACDTPRASSLVFEALAQKLGTSSADAVLLRTEQGIEPLIAIYNVSCFQPALEALTEGRRRMTSFHESVDIIHVDEAELPVEAPATNVNTPFELRAEREFFGEDVKEREA